MDIKHIAYSGVLISSQSCHNETDVITALYIHRQTYSKLIVGISLLSLGTGSHLRLVACVSVMC